MGALGWPALVRPMAPRGYHRARGFRRRVSGRVRPAACAVDLYGMECGIRSNGVVLTERGT
jgi:hypothetical protein